MKFINNNYYYYRNAGKRDLIYMERNFNLYKEIFI